MVRGTFAVPFDNILEAGKHSKCISSGFREECRKNVSSSFLGRAEVYAPLHLRTGAQPTAAF